MNYLQCDDKTPARFADGQLDAVESRDFEDHLESCEACRHRLEQHVASDSDWQSAKEILSHSFVADAHADECQTEPHLLEHLIGQVQSLLAPTEHPEFLGRIGQYEVVAIVGRGGAGIVLKAFDRALSRNVAIKILSPEFAVVGPARERFAREAKAMASVMHENLVPIFEVSTHQGLPYFVMEFLPGGSLGRRLRDQGTFDVLSVVRIGMQVATALAEAHAQGLVHRDIKPDNILLDRGTDRVRVADFGLVRVMGEASATQSGLVTGTPQFMSPEQVRGETCDGRSDLFSLGVVMYTLCAGQTPFRADTAYGVMQKVLRDQPRPLRESSPEIPAWLEAFIFKLLEKDPSARFASAKEVGELLRDELAHIQSPQIAKRPPRQWRSFRPSMATRWGLAAATAFGLGLTTWGIVYWFGRDVANDSTKAASQTVWAEDASLPLLKNRVSRLLKNGRRDDPPPAEEEAMVDLRNRVDSLLTELLQEQESEE
jgi:serine/threonine protein kinase